MIYILAYAGALASLALWFLYRTNDTKSKAFQTAFFAALGAYGLSVLLADAAFDTKLGVLFRDLLVMAGSGLLFQLLSLNKRWFLIGSAASMAAFIWYYQNYMAYSFAEQQLEPIAYEAEGELLVELAEGEREDVLAVAVQKYGLRTQRAFLPADPTATELDDYLVIDVPASRANQLPEIIRQLQKISAVDWVEPNEQVSVSPLPAKKLPNINKKFGINDPGLEHLWGFEAMEVDQLYEFMEAQDLRPKRPALIAILDTGVDAEHEDIKGNYRSLKGNYDNDPKGHGTHCAGIAGAVSNNGVGVASFSRDNGFVNITSIKVLGASGIGSQKTIIQGILEAADAGADVISMSLGGLSNQTKERAYRKAVEYANKKGAIVVAAAGNSNRNAKGYAPAGVPGVIAVAAIDEELNRAVFSNYITDLKMGIAAPGVNIYSTIPRNNYNAYNGTSMATPYVAGLLGLMKSLKPDLDTHTAYRILHKSGKGTKNTKETGRLIQPAAAIKQLMK